MAWIILIALSGIWHQASAQDIVSPFTPMAWAGGMNSCQFCPIDMDLDGVDDLLVFDRHGNRILPFIYTGFANSVDYQIDTSFISHFPDLHDWVITADYNCDGKMDLFTYGLGGIRVFLNVSDTTLKFHLITNMLTSWFYSGYIGILVTPVDYPAFSDIDGDGDLDLLTFFGLGSFVEYHQNLSMEKYGTCDSLDYRLETNCFGKFKESEGSNKIILNADCPGSLAHQSSVHSPQSTISTSSHHHITTSPKHTGSTLLAIDLTNNGLKDLLLADMDFPNLIALYNHGTIDSAFMTSMDTLFPSNTQPVDLFDFPATSQVDVNHDGLQDLVVSPFNPSLSISDNYNSIWYYKNIVSQEQPQYEFQTQRLFQDKMIDVGSNSYPLLYDLSNDGLQDLLIGCWGRYDSSFYEEAILHSVFTGRIAYYENRGTPATPIFSWITDDLAGLSSLQLIGLYPALGDITGDQYPDLIIGQEDGTLALLENDGAGSSPPGFLSPQWKFQGVDVGENSTPQLYDFNHDGLLDLIIGERNGNLNYYKNTGTTSSPVFTYVTDSLGKVNVTNYQLSYTGYSTPRFFQNHLGDDQLIVGSEDGTLWYFNEIPSDPEAPYIPSQLVYELISSGPFPVRCGWRTAPAIGFLSDTIKMDLVIGNFSGGLNYFSNKSYPEVLLGAPYIQIQQRESFTIFPNPATEIIFIKTPPAHQFNLLQVEIRNLYGQTLFSSTLQNSSTISPGYLPNGLYIITLVDLTNNTSFAPQKVIIQH